MIRAIFFDLDGTLLPIDTEKFRTAYIELVSKYTPDITAEQVRKAIDMASAAMLANRSPLRTNHDVFAQSLKDTHGIIWSEIEPAANVDIVHEFEKLKTMCPPSPISAEIVHAANDAGMDCVLLDNPIRPLKMVLAMLKWVGLRSSDFMFITSYENNTYTKPSPELFEQVMFSVGYAPDQCLIVGNDPMMDLMPAHQVGMVTYLLVNYRMPYDGERFWDREGTYEDLLQFVKKL